MGLIRDTLKGAKGAVKDLGNSASGGVLGGFTGALNQAAFQEYFVSGDMSGDILMKRAERAGVSIMVMPCFGYIPDLYRCILDFIYHALSKHYFHNSLYNCTF